MISPHSFGTRHSDGFARGWHHAVQHCEQTRRTVRHAFGAQRCACKIGRRFRALSFNVLRAEQARRFECRTGVPCENADQVEILQVERAVIR